MKEPETYKSNESLEAAFLGNLIQQLDSSSEVEVHVLKADKEKGIISAEVTETYRHPNGKEGKVSCRRTFVLDQRDESLLREKKSYLINFYAEGDLKEDNLYKSSLLLEGEEIKEPKVPEKKEHIFLEWRNARTHEKAEFNGGVYQEENFYAVWTEAR
ncbi:MAG: hypothetical protein HFI37_06665 [Lachnospiraceae bacterium]|nr:hypothetical protein [Lachnospiraceae bacterium]